ncbi:MAG: hypothetical protein M3Z37_02780 [Candidatus Eremiobacteraeota bacterium]|nr:hypothetical protein [Candidatus Eremiobacteraeota bacterium]
MRTQFFCGPLQVRLQTSEPTLYAKIAETLSLYDFTWPAPYREVHIQASLNDELPVPAAGSFLQCSRMLVDHASDSLYATTTAGASASGALAETSERWTIRVPAALVEAGKIEELEDLLSLVLTTGWRRHGWTPIHAAAVVKDGACAIICAPTGGGKTTLTAALVRRGWKVLGDDKLLLRLRDGRPEIAALLHTFNLHPKTREWFPEVGDLERLPRYSAWTEKRKVSVKSIWSDASAIAAQPTVLVLLERSPTATDVRIDPLDQAAVLAALARQTAIPAEPATARLIISNVASAALQLRGLHIKVPNDVYRDAAVLTTIEARLESAT